jgi:hypothetical protein
MGASQVKYSSVTEVNAADGSCVLTVPGSDFGLSGPSGLVAAGQQVRVAITTTAQVGPPDLS